MTNNYKELKEQNVALAKDILANAREKHTQSDSLQEQGHKEFITALRAVRSEMQIWGATEEELDKFEEAKAFLDKMYIKYVIAQSEALTELVLYGKPSDEILSMNKSGKLYSDIAEELGVPFDHSDKTYISEETKEHILFYHKRGFNAETISRKVKKPMAAVKRVIQELA